MTNPSHQNSNNIFNFEQTFVAKCTGFTNIIYNRYVFTVSFIALSMQMCCIRPSRKLLRVINLF